MKCRCGKEMALDYATDVGNKYICVSCGSYCVEEFGTTRFGGKSIIAKNFDNGILTKKQNAAGGWSYYYDSVIPVMVWDDCIGTKEALIAIAKDCYGLKLVEESHYGIGGNK